MTATEFWMDIPHAAACTCRECLEAKIEGLARERERAIRPPTDYVHCSDDPVERQFGWMLYLVIRLKIQFPGARTVEQALWEECTKALRSARRRGMEDAGGDGDLRTLAERDQREEQLEAIFRAAGGEREDVWFASVPPQPPPESGDAGADALCLVERMSRERAEAWDIVESLEEYDADGVGLAEAFEARDRCISAVRARAESAEADLVTTMRVARAFFDSMSAALRRHSEPELDMRLVDELNEILERRGARAQPESQEQPRVPSAARANGRVSREASATGEGVRATIPAQPELAPVSSASCATLPAAERELARAANDVVPLCGCSGLCATCRRFYRAQAAYSAALFANEQEQPVPAGEEARDELPDSSAPAPAPHSEGVLLAQCIFCGHRLRFMADGCPQCDAYFPKLENDADYVVMADVCACWRCTDARAEPERIHTCGACEGESVCSCPKADGGSRS